MSDQSREWCRECEASMLVTRPGVNHVLHLLVTLTTCGLWAFVWLGIALFGGGRWRCSKCGLAAR